MKNIFKYYSSFLCVLISLNGCINNKVIAISNIKQPYITNTVQKKEVFTNADSIKSLAKEDFGMVELSIIGDTLNLVSTNSFLYYPFGKFKSYRDFTSTNKPFYETIERDKSDPSITFHRMSFKKSFIKLFKYDNKSYIEIVSGKFSDPEIILINGIKIGISKTDFLKMFFKDFSANQIDGVKVIKLISGLEGISHVYVFTNGHLIYFYFNTDYTFDKN